MESPVPLLSDPQSLAITVAGSGVDARADQPSRLEVLKQHARREDFLSNPIASDGTNAHQPGTFFQVQMGNFLWLVSPKKGGSLQALGWSFS